MDFGKELQLGIAAVRQAANICQAVQAEITQDVIEKKDRSPVTIADFASQAVICHQLSTHLPGDHVIAEEDSAELRAADDEIRNRAIAQVTSEWPQATDELIYDAIDHGFHRQASPRFWTLDPVDGTKGFIRGEQYAISLSLIIDGEITVGILGCPNLPFQSHGGSLLTAVKGQGAFVRPLSGSDEPQPISVSEAGDSSQTRFCESVESGHSDHSEAAQIANRLGITAEPVRLDSQAKYAIIAQGQAGIYMRLPTRAGYREKIWDHAAGVLMVTEAGGRVSDIHGNELDFGAGAELQEGGGALATNGHLHNAVVRAIAGK